LTTVYDVPPHDLIAALAKELKAAGKVQPPEWAEFAKTGVNKEMPPSTQIGGMFGVHQCCAEYTSMGQWESPGSEAFMAESSANRCVQAAL